MNVSEKSRRHVQVNRVKTKRTAIRARIQKALELEVSRLRDQAKLIKTADEEVLSRAMEVFESAEGATSWLTEKNSFCKGRTPLELSITEDEKSEVLMMLGRIDHGVFG